jgi:hypothetical protein
MSSAFDISPRQLGEVREYADLLKLAQARMDELGITYETLDALSGVTDRYSQKILGSRPIKRLGPISLPAILGSLGMKLVAVEDSAALDRIRHRLAPRKGRPRTAARQCELPFKG